MLETIFYAFAIYVFCFMQHVFCQISVAHFHIVGNLILQEFEF